MAQPAFILSVDSSVNNALYDKLALWTLSKSPNLSVSLQVEDCLVICILLADEWPGLLLTFSADSGWLEQLNRNHIHNYGNVN